MSNRLYRPRGYRSTPLWVKTAMVMLGIFFLFVAGVTVFRRAPAKPIQTNIPTVDDIVAAVTSSVPTPQPSTLRETPRGVAESAELSGTGSSTASATTKRVMEDGVFKHTILARGLAEIDPFVSRYQAWLVRPYPFDFVETASLVRNADGSWGMMWVGESGKNYDDFVQVLVTLEPTDGDDNPSVHQVLKGTF